jgi:hypothetical protein
MFLLYVFRDIILIQLLILSFWGKTSFSSKIHVFRSDQFSLLHRCLLSSSVTIKMDYEENMENVRYTTNDDTPLVYDKNYYCNVWRYLLYTNV